MSIIWFRRRRGGVSWGRRRKRWKRHFSIISLLASPKVDLSCCAFCSQYQLPPPPRPLNTSPFPHPRELTNPHLRNAEEMAGKSEDQMTTMMVKSEAQEQEITGEQMNEEEGIENEDEVWEACLFPGKRRRSLGKGACEQPTSNSQRSVASIVRSPPASQTLHPSTPHPPFSCCAALHARCGVAQGGRGGGKD